MPIILDVDLDGPETEARREYWLVLGMFIHKFALVEQQILFTMRLVADIPHDTAKALFSGTRARTAFDNIKRVFEVRGLPEHPMFNRVIEKFGQINSTRDDIVHLGATLANDAFEVSNVHRNIPKKATIRSVPPSSIRNMIEDLGTISACLYHLQCEYSGHPLTGDDLERNQKVALTPWRYKPISRSAPLRRTSRP